MYKVIFMEVLKIKILNEITINEYLNNLGLGKSKINSLVDGKKIKCGKTIVKQNMLLKKDDVLFIDIEDYEKIDSIIREKMIETRKKLIELREKKKKKCK